MQIRIVGNPLGFFPAMAYTYTVLFEIPINTLAKRFIMNKKFVSLLATITVITGLTMGSTNASAYVKCQKPASKYPNVQYGIWAEGCSIQPGQNQCNMGCVVLTKDKGQTVYLTSVILYNYKPCLDNGGKITLTVPDENVLFPSLVCQ